MTAKQRRYERTVIAYLARIESKMDALCKAAGIDPETLIDFDTLRAIEDNAEGDDGFDNSGEELQPDPGLDVITSEPEPAPEPVQAPASPAPKPNGKAKPH